VIHNSIFGAFIRFRPYIGNGMRNVTVKNIDMVQGCERSTNKAVLAILLSKLTEVLARSTFSSG